MWVTISGYVQKEFQEDTTVSMETLRHHKSKAAALRWVRNNPHGYDFTEVLKSASDGSFEFVCSI
jgi:hypothetical protein